MNYAQLVQPAAIPAAVSSFDPDAGDCTCVHPVQINSPPTKMLRMMKAAALRSATSHETEPALDVTTAAQGL